MSELQAFLDERAQAAGVPGAAFGLLRDGEISSFATGTLELGSDRPATVSSLFRLGSVTKLYTATLVVRLLGDELDTPVSKWVGHIDDAVTVRHLLTHSYGLAGDHFEDCGFQDDCIERYVDGLRHVGRVHPVGALFSYSNSGMILAGRVAEIVSGMPFERALTEIVLRPAGLHDTVPLPEELVVRVRRGETSHADVDRLAVGHLPGDGGLQPVAADRDLAAIWTRAIAPAGSTLSATAADLVRFARWHLDQGGPIASMREFQLPNRGPHGSGVGFGWQLDEVDGHRIVMHAGQHEGQGAALWVLPDQNFAFSFVSNGPTGMMLVLELAAKLRELTGLPLPQRGTAPVPSEPPAVDLGRYAGDYFPGLRLEARDGFLAARFEGALDVLPEMPLVPLDETTFHLGGSPAATFFEDGGEQYLHLMNRAYRKVS